MSVGEGAVGGNTLGALLTRLRRYWLVVVAVTALAALGAIAATAMTPTTFVGRSSLIVSSNNRSPDQDAVLVQGYVEYFNDSAYQQRLLASVGVHGDVALSAAPAASSPIVVISATTRDRSQAQSDAVQAAKAFMDDINESSASSDAQQLSTLRDELSRAQASNDPNADTVISDLQDQIDQVQSDRTNMLQVLQVDGGVAPQSPSLSSNLVLAVVGGLLVGALAALVLARSSRRLPTAVEVADKVGLNTLVELPRSRRKAGRARQRQRLAQLANIVRSRLGGPGVVAIAQPEDGSASSLVARRLAGEWVKQGYRAVVVSADDAVSASDAGDLLAREVRAGQYVIVEARALVQSSVAQALCQAADQVILVVDPKVTRVSAAREAVGVLRQTGTRLMGAVVAGMRRSDIPVAGVDGVPAERPSTVPAQALSDEPPLEDPVELRSDQPERVGGSSLDGAP